MEHIKCRLETFKGVTGNFLALPKENLVLYRRGRAVYCFTDEEAQRLLSSTKPVIPNTKIPLPKNFMTALSSYLHKASINAPELQERISGERGTSVTNLGWDRAIKYCINEFNRFIGGWDKDLSRYTEKVSLGGCNAYTEEFIKIATLIKDLFPSEELEKGNWILKWHENYPGVELDTRDGKLLKPSVLPPDNMFNCQLNVPGYWFNNGVCFGDRTITEFIEYLFVKDTLEPTYTEPIKKWSLGSLRIPSKDIQNIDIKETKSTFGWSSNRKKAKITTPNGMYTITGAETDKAVEMLKSGKTIDVVNTQIKIEFAQDTPPDISKIAADGKIYFGQKYKIHLQPKPEYQLWTMKKVFNILNEPEIRPYVSGIKAIVPYTRVLAKQSIPSIVVYPVFGQKPAQTVLNVIAKTFKGTESQIGLGITPRYNHTLNSLVYWANGDGNFKETLLKSGKLDEYYDSKVNWAHILCGEEQDKCHIEPQIL